MREIIFFAALAVSFAVSLSGCTDQRDLYLTSRPLLQIDSDWEPSLSRTDMRMNATAVLYAAQGGAMFSKNYFSQPTSVTVPVKRGQYDILLFNGMMYSEKDTHLDKIFFRGTDRITTFEAVASVGEANNRLPRVVGEYIASNEMELLAAMYGYQEIESDVDYYVKYRNGRGVSSEGADYVEAALFLEPRAVSYECRVYVRMTNPRSAYTANGSLRGFSGSVFLRDRMPSAMEVTHQFRLNDMQILGQTDDEGDERGEIRSPVFVTFGPPLDIPERSYTVELSIVLINGDTYEGAFDVGDQILPVIERIRKNLANDQPAEHGITIPVTVDIELPKIEIIGGGSIGVGDWGEDELIRIPIRI